MKRLIRFLVLFGFGLLALVLALGPGHLLRRSPEPTIAPTNVGDVHTPVQVADPEKKGRSIGVSLQGAGRMPMWKTILQADGSTLSVRAAVIAYDAIEPFGTGFHLTNPVIEIYPGQGAEEKPNARINAGGADVAMRNAQGVADLANPRTEDIREFVLSPSVVLHQLDAEGNVDLTLETERLESPAPPDPAPTSQETAAAHAKQVTILQRLIAPGPVHLFRANSSLDIHAGAMELERVDGLLTLQPPIAIHGTELSMPGLGAQEPPAEGATRPPLTLTCDGVSTFVRREALAAAKKPGSAPGATAPAADAMQAGRVLGPGELTFTRNVHLQQEEPDNPVGRWLRSDRVVVEIDEDDAGKLAAKRFDAGAENAPVALGLLGGEGDARALHWDATLNALVLDGPLHLDGVTVGEGTQAKKLDLSAGEKLVARQLAAEGDLPARVTVELTKAAHARIPDELTADGERLIATLVPPAKGAGGGAKLLSVEIFGGEQFATAEMAGRGKARARKLLRLVDDGAGGHVAHLEGEARADVDRGFVEGEVIDVVAPADEKQPTRVTVPVVSGGEIALPGGASPFDAGFVAPSGGGASGDATPPRRLLLEPLATCRLTSAGDQLDLIGRCRYHVRPVGVEVDTQTLECNELHLVPAANDAFDARALGDVSIDYVEQGLHARAAFAHTEGDKSRRLILDGNPALVTFAVPGKDPAAPARGEMTTTAARLVLELQTGELIADDEREQVLVLLPDELLADALPSARFSGAGAAAADPSAPPPERAQVRADHLVVTPAAGAATRSEALANARFHALGHVTIDRPATGGTVRCRELTLDRARGFARLDGDPDDPVVIQEPKPYAPDRVDSITAVWLEARDHGHELDTAANSDIVLHKEDAPTAAKPVPNLLRIELRPADEAKLRGPLLSLGGGVETTITRVHDERGHAPVQDQIHARSERVELTLSRSLDERGAVGKPEEKLEPLVLRASQRVRVDDGDYHAEGNLLVFDIAGGELELKEGVQPCRLVGQDEHGAWHANATFRSMKQKLPKDDEPLPAPKFERLQLKVERAREVGVAGGR